MHFSMASVPTGTAVSVGISTKLTLAEIGRHDKKIAQETQVDNVIDSFYRERKKRNIVDFRKICKMKGCC